MRNKIVLLLGLLIPIFGLLGLTSYYEYLIYNAHEITLPINVEQHFFSQDLMQVDYGINDICDHKSYKTETSYICLEPKMFSYTMPKHCEILIQGECRYTGFKAGIEYFHISEDMAMNLRKLNANDNMQILLRITKHGQAYIKSLLINNKPWQ
jgi:hypothetical protein